MIRKEIVPVRKRNYLKEKEIKCSFEEKKWLALAMSTQ